MASNRPKIQLNPSQTFAWTCYNVLQTLQELKEHSHPSDMIEEDEDALDMDWTHLEAKDAAISIEPIIPDGKDDYGVYGARFESFDQIVYVMSPAVDDEKITTNSAGAIPLPMVLDRVKALQLEEKAKSDKTVTFQIPISECHNILYLDAPLRMIGYDDSALRQHWTLLVLCENKYEFYDSKSAGFSVYPLSYLESYLQDKKFTASQISCLTWQETEDRDYCGYFVGAAAGRRIGGTLSAQDKPINTALKTEFDCMFNFESQPIMIPKELRPILLNRYIKAVRQNEYYRVVKEIQDLNNEAVAQTGVSAAENKTSLTPPREDAAKTAPPEPKISEATQTAQSKSNISEAQPKGQLEPKISATMQSIPQAPKTPEDVQTTQLNPKISAATQTIQPDPEISAVTQTILPEPKILAAVPVISKPETTTFQPIAREPQSNSYKFIGILLFLAAIIMLPQMAGPIEAALLLSALLGAGGCAVIAQRQPNTSAERIGVSNSLPKTNKPEINTPSSTAVLMRAGINVQPGIYVAQESKILNQVAPSITPPSNEPTIKPKLGR